MAAAVDYVNKGNPLREGSRLYNIPVETLRRRVEQQQTWPSTVLAEDEEDQLAKYIVEMADRGF